MKEKIIKLLNKIYKEKDEKKIYSLIYKIRLLVSQDYEKFKKVIFEMPENYNDKLLKIIELGNKNPEWLGQMGKDRKKYYERKKVKENKNERGF